jgi:hypothetical protein
MTRILRERKKGLGLIGLMVVLALCLGAAKKPAKKDTTKVQPGKPEISRVEPRGIQRGTTARVKLIGTNLLGLTEVRFSNTNLTGAPLDEPEPTANEAWIEISAAANLARGPYEFAAANATNESAKVKLYADDLAQVSESALDERKGEKAALQLPFSFWGTLDPPADSDDIEFEADAGASIVLDVSAKNIGSKAEATLSLFDDSGALLAANNGFDEGDPLMSFKIPRAGRYRVRIKDAIARGSKDHFYRVSIGTFPVVFGCYPLSVPADKESEVALIGYNLPANSTTRVKTGQSGEAEVNVDGEKFRSRRSLKVLVDTEATVMEAEPNDTAEQATRIPLPAIVNGRVRTTKDHAADADLFRFNAKAGQTLVIETDAARRGSPADTKIEVLDAGGKPVERLLLQAVRDSHVTFRPINSDTDDLRVENWQEMELNQLMFLQGEVCKIFRMPQGPDSGFQFYSFKGKRRDYFDTSAAAHALDEAIYIVEPHPPGTKPLPNGLPSFPVYYANDDDADRELGTDSRLLFAAPADGEYLVRVADTRGYGGERFAYRLIVREATPDFKVTLNGTNPTVNAGTGKQFSLTVDRIDGFDGDVRVDITGLPPGFMASTPVVIQAGHLEAKGTIHAAADAAQLAETNSRAMKMTATATVAGRAVTKEVNNFGKIKLAEKPKLFVALEPYDESLTNFVERAITDKPLEITISPGQSIPAWLKVKRNGHDDLVTFTVEGLPHGVIVDNIGLNGVLIPKEEDRRQIFLTAAKWVPDTDRLCFAEAKQVELPTSLPVLLHVRKPPLNAALNPR